MAKTYIDTVKYLIYTEVEIHGLVEKPDVVGAIFGQTEGLLGDELDLRDLQKNGRIGRIEVDLKAIGGKTVGSIKIPSSLDMVETCIIAAALETVDRVGPCEARLGVGKIEDTRNVKRKVLVDRAKNLLKNLLNNEIPESKEISDLVRDEVKTAEVVEYGKERLTAGPSIDRMNEVIFVEGRADVVNMLKNDITNVVAIGGAKVSKGIVELSLKKEVTVFLDGDRGGDIILNELIQSGTEIDYVARAPTGMEVEELTRKEIIKCLRNKIPFEQNERERGKNQDYRTRRTRADPRELAFNTPAVEEPKIMVPRPKPIAMPVIIETRQPVKKAEVVETVIVGGGKRLTREELKNELEALSNTLRARLYDPNYAMIKEIPVRDVIKSLEDTDGVESIVFDGIITQRLVDLAYKKGIKLVVGLKIGNVSKKPEGIEIVTKNK